MARVGGIERVTGNLASEPEKIPHPSQNPDEFLTVFAVAENRGYADRQTGEWVERPPVYYSVAVDSEDGRMAQNILDSVHKGDRVTVEGRYNVEPYINQKTGEAGLNHKMWARDVSPSLKYATAEVSRNPKVENSAARAFTQEQGPRQDFQAQADQSLQHQHQPGTDFGAGSAGMGEPGMQ